MKLNSFQEHLMLTLLSDIKSGLKLRKKFTKSFDSAFEQLFGISFGVEIEIHPSFFRTDTNKWDNVNNWGRIIRIWEGSQFWDNVSLPKITKLTQKKTKNSDHKVKVYQDGSLNELTFPVCVTNLYLIQNLLTKLNKELTYKIGGIDDTSSSMHIHQSNILPSTRTSHNEIHEVYDYITSIISNDQLTYLLGKTEKSNTTKLSKIVNFLSDEDYVAGLLQLNELYNTVETRCYLGTLDLRLILKRVLLTKGIYELLKTTDAHTLTILQKSL